MLTSPHAFTDINGSVNMLRLKTNRYLIGDRTVSRVMKRATDRSNKQNESRHKVWRSEGERGAWG